MLIIKDASLAEFYRDYTNHLTEAGYDLLILAVVRDADAPGFYDDVLRYWSSLHDLTGPNVVFAVAGSMPQDFEARQQFVGEKTSPMFLGKPGSAPTIASHQEIPYFRYGGDRHPGFDLEDFRSVTRFKDSNSVQISDLRDYLGLREEDLPCLSISMLNADRPKTVTYELNFARRSSVYAICKEVMIELGAILREIDEFRKNRIAAVREVNNRLHEICSLLKRPPRPVRKALAAFESLEIAFLDGKTHPSIAELIVDLPKRAWRKDTKIWANELVNNFRKSVSISEWQSVRAIIQRAVDIWVDGKFTREGSVEELSFRKELESEKSELVSLLQSEKANYDASICDASERLSRKLSGLGLTLEARQVEHVKWEYFLSYASPDVEVVEQMYLSFPEKTRVFMDKYCLRPGVNWREAIEHAQERAKATIPFISRHTREAHYQNSEIQKAVNLYRTRKHTVQPVVHDRTTPVPLGIEQFHSLYLEDLSPHSIGQVLIRGEEN